MSAKQKLGAAAVIGVVAALWLYACVSSGPGSDFDDDGLKDSIEDTNGNFAFDPGESDFLIADTDSDGLCDGEPDHPLTTCNGCEDCNNNGFFEPCLGETDPLNNDTDNDGIPDGEDPDPLDNLAIDCSQGNVQLPYGASLPPGKPFPVPPTPTLTPAPFPTSTPGPPPTPSASITPSL
jgi:hypothetical protein